MSDDDLFSAARRGSVEEFEAAYDPSRKDTAYATGSLLSLALQNPDHAARVAIANRLLDDGADVTEHDPVHVLCAHGDHDFEAEPALLKRMLDAGADVNKVLPRFGTPLEALASVMKFEDDELAPFYDVLFARPDLDLGRESESGRTVVENIRKLPPPKRGDLMARADAHLADHG